MESGRWRKCEREREIERVSERKRDRSLEGWGVDKKERDGSKWTDEEKCVNCKFYNGGKLKGSFVTLCMCQ